MNHSIYLRACVALALASVSHHAMATNGYYAHGLGTRSKALAGAGTAMPETAMAIAANPASAVLVGERFEAGAAVFSPRRAFSASASLANGQGGAFTIGEGTVNSGSEFFAVPYIAKTWARGDDAGFGLALYGRGGMNTDYTSGSATFDPDGPGPATVMTLPGPYGAGKAGVDLSQLFVDLSYSKRTGSLAWGGGVVLVAQAFQGNGFATFAPYTQSFAASGGTTLPASLTNNDHDTSFGAGLKFGVIWEAGERVNLGISYQGEISMSKFDDYSDLFAQGGGFDIPSSLRAGLSIATRDNASFHYDIEHTTYSEVDSVGNPLANLFACPTAGAGGTSLGSCLGGGSGAGFGWDDMTTHKFGYEWQPAGRSGWTMRVGYSRGDQPIPTSEVLFNMMAPGVMEQHLTFGFTRETASEREFSMSVMFAPEKKISGTNPFDPTQQIELKMHQFEVEFGFRW